MCVKDLCVSCVSICKRKYLHALNVYAAAVAIFIGWKQLK